MAEKSLFTKKELRSIQIVTVGCFAGAMAGTWLGILAFRTWAPKLGATFTVAPFLWVGLPCVVGSGACILGVALLRLHRRKQLRTTGNNTW
jgi:hypothetical protein